MIGIVLAGGASSRMGSDKALVSFRGRPMADWVIDAFLVAGCDPIISGAISRPRARTIPDGYGGRRGPAAGLATVLRASGADRAVLVATDQPLVRPETLLGLMSLDGEAVIPIDAGARQYTCAVYGGSWLDAMTPGLDSGRSISLRAVAASAGARDVHRDEWAAWGEDGRSWWSLDTPGDLAAAESWKPGEPIPERHARRPRARREAPEL